MPDYQCHDISPQQLASAMPSLRAGPSGFHVSFRVITSRSFMGSRVSNRLSLWRRASARCIGFSGYTEYWLTVLETIFRAYGRIAGLSRQERSLAWSMLMTIELTVMKSCLDGQAREAALMNQDILFWFEDHRSQIEAAIAS